MTKETPRMSRFMKVCLVFSISMMLVASGIFLVSQLIRTEVSSDGGTGPFGNETLPDLSISSADIWFWDDSPEEGEIVYIIASVHNIGGSAAYNFTVEFWDDVCEGCPAMWLIGEDVVQELPPGHLTNVTVLWNTSGQPGNNVITVRVDPQNFVLESNEENNEASKSIYVTPTSDNTPPEIHMVMVNGWHEVKVPAGSVVELEATIDDTMTGMSNILNANYTIGQANWPSSTPMEPIDGCFDSPMEIVRADIDTTGWADGRYETWVYACDWADNCNTTGDFATIEISENITGPDLLIAHEDFHIWDWEPDLGQVVHMFALVRNIGDQDAHNVTVRFVDWYEVNMTIIDDVFVGSIPPGGVANASTDWVAGPVGLHLIEAIADPDDIIPEIDETNNVASRIVIVGGQQPLEGPWPMFRQNTNHTGLSPYDTSGNNGELEWSFQTGHIIESSPAVGFDGTIYVGSADNFTYAINPDGTEKWKLWTGTVYQSSPAIGLDGTVYIGSIGFLGQNDSKFYAINPDGTEKWSIPNLGIRSSPVIGPDSTIYVGSCDGNLYAINPDGTVKWSYATIGHIHSSPAIAFDGTVYVGSTDGNLYAINPDGSAKWATGVSLVDYSSPAIGSDGTIYIGTHNGRLVAVNSNGTAKWTFTTGGNVESSAGIGSDGTIYVGSYDNKVYALNPDGTEKWHFTTNGDVESSPAIGADGTIFVGSNDNKLYAINPDGTEKWRFTAGSHIYSSPAIGTDGTIYVGSHYGKLYAVGKGKPDLTIGDIHFSDDTPEEGQTVFIWANVHNIGTQDAYNVTVQFIDWFEGIELPLPEAIIDFIPAGSCGNATTVWLAIPAGNHTIEVTADPLNLIPESDEGNNVASRCVTVSPTGEYQIFVQATMFDNDNDGKYDDVVILVYDSNNHAVEGASIFVNGTFYGLTADTGLLILENFSLGTYDVDAIFGSLSAETTFYSEG